MLRWGMLSYKMSWYTMIIMLGHNMFWNKEIYDAQPPYAMTWKLCYVWNDV